MLTIYYFIVKLICNGLQYYYNITIYSVQYFFLFEGGAVTNMSKHYILSLFSSIILAIILTFIQGTADFFLHLTNIIFYIGLTLFVIGGFLLIVQSGFFNITRYGIRKVFGLREEKIAKMTGDETLAVKKEMLYRRYSFTSTKPLLMAAITLIVLSVAFTFIIIS